MAWGEIVMPGGVFNKGGKTISFGFNGITDWFDSIIASFPAPWVIGDDTHYGTPIFDSRGVKIISVWMAWGNPSERQRGTMSDEEWLECCCDTHWESETQWHLANAIITTRNYLKAHAERGWYGDDERQRDILRNLIMAYGHWETPDSEIACGGPDRRLTTKEAEKLNPRLRMSSAESGQASGWKERERQSILAKIRAATPTVANNPEAAESHNRRHAMMSAVWKMLEERPPTTLSLESGLRIDSFTMMDKSYLERMVEIADEEYDRLKKEQEPGALI